MAKEKDLTELVWAEKDGYERRQFTRQQLNAMGSDPGGNTFDGWKITQEAKEPKEVTAAKKGRQQKEPAKEPIDVTPEIYEEFVKANGTDGSHPEFGSDGANEVIASDDFQKFLATKNEAK